MSNSNIKDIISTSRVENTTSAKTHIVRIVIYGVYYESMPVPEAVAEVEAKNLNAKGYNAYIVEYATSTTATYKEHKHVR